MEQFVEAMRPYLLAALGLLGSTPYFVSFHREGGGRGNASVRERWVAKWRGRKLLIKDGGNTYLNPVFTAMAATWLVCVRIYAIVLGTALNGLLMLIYVIWPWLVVAAVVVIALWCWRRFDWHWQDMLVVKPGDYRKLPMSYNEELLKRRQAEIDRLEALAAEQAAREAQDDKELNKRRRNRQGVIDPENPLPPTGRE